MSAINIITLFIVISLIRPQTATQLPVASGVIMDSTATPPRSALLYSLSFCSLFICVLSSCSLVTSFISLMFFIHLRVLSSCSSCSFISFPHVIHSSVCSFSIFVNSHSLSCSSYIYIFFLHFFVLFSFAFVTFYLPPSSTYSKNNT